MTCFQSKLGIKTQLMLSRANGKPSPLCSGSGSGLNSCTPDDEQDLFGREALRMDEEIMNFQRFHNVTSDSIKDLRSTTYVQSPPRFKFALQQAQHAILRAIMHKTLSSLASGPAWKALVLSSWLLLGRPAVNASESNRAHYLNSSGPRIRQHSGLFYVPNVMLLQCRMPRAAQLHNRNSHEFARWPHLLDQVKKDEPWLQPETHRQSQSQSKLFKRSRVSTRQNLQLLHRLLCQICSGQKWLS